MLGYRPIFCVCYRNPQNAAECVPHFLIGTKMKVIKSKSKTKHGKQNILSKDEKNPPQKTSTFKNIK